jgi:hypothetical protein
MCDGTAQFKIDLDSDAANDFHDASFDRMLLNRTVTGEAWTLARWANRPSP